MAKSDGFTARFASTGTTDSTTRRLTTLLPTFSSQIIFATFTVFLILNIQQTDALPAHSRQPGQVTTNSPSKKPPLEVYQRYYFPAAQPHVLFAPLHQPDSPLHQLTRTRMHAPGPCRANASTPKAQANLLTCVHPT